LSGQAAARDNLQVAAAVQFLIHHHCQLAAGQTVAHGHLVAPHKAHDFRLQQAALHPVAQGIGAIQHHQPLPGSSAILDAIAQRGEEGIVPASHIRHIIHQRVKQRQRLLGQPLGGFGIKAADSQAAFPVDFILKQRPRRLVSPHAMLRCQQQLQIAAFFQYIDGGAIVAGAPRGSGEQCHPSLKNIPVFLRPVSAI